MGRRSTLRWTAFCALTVVVVVGIIVYDRSGEEPPASTPSSDNPAGAALTTDASTGNGLEPPTGEVLINGHPIEPPAPMTTLADTPADFSFASLTSFEPQELDSRFAELVQALYGYDAHDVQGLDQLNCKVSEEATYQEVAALDTALVPYLAQLQQARDAQFDALFAAGVINDPTGDETPVLPVLKSQKIQGQWAGACALFSSQGFITAQARLSDRLVATQRSPDGSQLYLRVPIKRMVTLRTLDTTLPVDSSSEPELKTEWHFKNGHWVLMYYGPE